MAVNHGTRSCYVTGCRRPECRRAATAYMKAWRSRQNALPPGDPRHGTYSAYANYRCHCGPCSAANAKKSRGNREKAKS